MKKILLGFSCLFLCANIFAQAPVISYGSGAKTFYTGEAITPLLPTNTGGTVAGTGVGQVATFAGNGSFGSNVNGTGTAASFSNPTGMAVDAQGNIYVADAYTAAIRKITPAGVVTTLAGGSTTGSQNGTGSAASFNTPTGLAVDINGNVYVADRGNNLIRKITPAGVVTTLAGSGNPVSSNGTGTAASFNGPAGVAVDANGNVYVVEVYSHLIRKITPAGAVTTFAGNGSGSNDGTGTAASFNGPYGITVDATGNLYVAELYSSRIRKITPAAEVTTFAGTGFNGATNGTGTAASFNAPRGVYAATDGNIYVADHGNNLIRQITSAGVVTTVAGSGSGGNTNGSAATATFANPSGTVMAGGYLYVSDSNNNLIRSVSLGGYSIQPALPEGLVFNSSTGAISGTPATITAAADYVVTGINSSGSGQTTVNIKTTIPTVPPEITSATPMSAGINRAITITGKNFLGATGVSIGGAAAASFRVLSPTSITAVIAQTATSGDIKVTNPYGTGTLTGFVLLPPPAISYAGPKTFFTGEAITPLTPTSTGSAIPASGYSNVSTFAGSTTSGSTNGTGTAASFYSPSATVTDALGNLYVADFYSNKIRKITPDGVVTTFAGSGNYGAANGTGTSASFNQPSGLAIDVAGNIYVADRGNNIIRKVSPTAEVSTFAGSGSYGSVNGTATAASFNTPAGIAIDASGNLFVTDYGSGLIRKITPAGVVSTFAGGGGNYTSVNGTGTLASFYGPYGIAIDAANNLYVAEANANLIRKITPAAVVTTLAGSGQQGFVNGNGTAANFNGPRGITVDADNSLYVADNNNHAIRKISAEGVVTTFAGKGTMGSQNGDAANATFNYPVGVSIAAARLYVADGGNNMIRSISLAGYSITPTLPNGLTFDNRTGTISGTPAAISPATDYTILASNDNGTAKATLSIATPIPTVPAELVSATPLSAGADRAITITGKNFLGATAVTIGGAPAAAFYIISPNTIKAVVAKTAVTGDITITNPYGTGTLPGFVFLPPPNISYTTPLPYTIGLTVAPLTPTNTGSPMTEEVYAQVSTFAGIRGSIGNTNGLITSATFNAPYGLASDKSGNLYVADPSAHVIRKISAAGEVTTLAGSGQQGFINGTGTAASFNYPYGIAVDGSGNVFVADFSNNSIRKITPAGVVTTVAGSRQAGSTNGTGTAARFYGPTGLVLDGAGNLYVTDQYNYRIQKITPAGVVTTFAGSGSYGNNINGTGTAASFASPMGIAIDGAENLYVTDGIYIRMITPAGVVSTYAGSNNGSTNGPKALASFSSPVGLAIDGAGNIYVSEQSNNRVRVITAAGFVTSLAGSGSIGSTNGVGGAATFYRPAGLATDGNGNLLVADQANNQIRSININGYFVSPTLPDGLAFDSKTGVISGKPTTLTPEAEYNITAQNPNGFGTAKVKLSVIPVSTDASLNAMTVSNINMLPAFTKGLYSYSATVDYTVTGLDVTPTTSNRYATITVNGKTVASGATSENIPLNVGVNAVSVSVTAQDGTTKLNYVLTVTRNKSVQTLTFPSLAAKTYGDADADPGATSNSQAFPITYSSNNAAVATIVNNKIHIVSAGTVNITASQAGSSDYLAAPDITIALTINPKSITVTADTKSKIYGDTDPVLTYAITAGGLVGTDAFTGAQIRDAGEQAGSYGVKQGTLALSTNYVLTYNGSKFTIDPRPITVTAVAKTKTYGDADPALTYTVSPGGLIGTDTFTGTLVRDAGDNAGTYAIKQGSVAITSNYALTYVAADLTIAPRPITITSAAKTKVYGDADPAFTYSITSGNLIGADAITGALTRQAGNDAGTYDILQGTVALTPNYAITYQTAKLTISKKALTITADNKTRSVGKADPTFTASYQGFVNNETSSSLTALPTITTTATATSLVGIYPLTPAGAQSNNYAFTYVNGSLSIIPAANNFKLSSTSVTCRGQNNGSISVVALQNANYTALLSGNGSNKSFTFNTTLTMDNLTPGTYRVCISDAALPSYQSCFDLVITEPKDLAVYSTVNRANNTVNLSLSGSSVYNISLNGKQYTATGSSITFPINRGINKLMVTTDKACQGVVEKEIDMVDGMKPFPSPFQDVMYINLGTLPVAKAVVKIYSVSDGSLKLNQTFTNQSGVIRLNVANLMMGAYSLHLSADGTDTVYKVIKQ